MSILSIKAKTKALYSDKLNMWSKVNLLALKPVEVKNIISIINNEIVHC